ncbi:branched-chain amino acid ABC transporter permease [Clostridium sp.]|uniref:branched-chain amino acid ABC transporter permease n=1 Tax=Clostridium sp. TaxID=1506 RepID=UPI002901350C|nr:branched-chain amino acid ABC transporter permease [Clostridium sp.]MDU3051080.1 branched-chain amino acid ABC transporter permease [Clostridium sp.]
MNTLLQQIVNGVCQGSVYALIAIGYTMVYGIIKLINFAHCDIYMFGAYAGYFAVSVLRFGFTETLVFAMVACAALGMLIERVAYKPLRNSPKVTLFITTMGVELLLQNLIKTDMLAGPNTKSFPEIIPLKSYSIGSVIISNYQIIAILTTVIFCILLQFIIKKTSVGRAMRATSYDISLTFALGSLLAGTAGVLVGLLYPKLTPAMGVMPGLKSFVAAVLGGIGIIPGAMVGGIIMGLIETLSKVYISSGLSDAIAFSILIIILLVKPTGLFGKNSREKV